VGDLAHKVVIAGVGFDIDVEPAKMRNMYDAPFWDASRAFCIPARPGQQVECGPGGAARAPANGLSRTHTRRCRPRWPKDTSLGAMQKYIRQFVIHLDGCAHAEMCWDVLQNERGLSCHFILDNDGTLYQTLDLALCGFHAAGLNETSIGIEISNRGDARRQRDYYTSRKQEDRPPLTCRIHDEVYTAFSFTEAQKQTMVALGRTLARALPGIPLTYPQRAGGEPIWARLRPGEGQKEEDALRNSYAGYLGHYHITQRKWDPGPWDFRWHISQLSGRWSFPVGLHGLAASAKPEIPEAPAQAREAAAAYYALNEETGSGFYPIGPMERYRLYHSGIHLLGERGDRVFAPIPGHVVAARDVPPRAEIGSTSFVLLAHRRKIGDADLRFWSLYYHLEHGGEKPRWMGAKGWDRSEIVLPSPEPVQAGEVIGFLGAAGPTGRAELHFEIFTDARGWAAVNQLEKKRWGPLLGHTDRRFCSRKELLDLVEAASEKRRRDGLVDEDELHWFFTESPERVRTHWMATYHLSEWTFEPDWKQALLESDEMQKKVWKLSAAELEDLVSEQILPGLWWNDDVEKKLGLPKDGLIWSFHPVTFLTWLAEKAGAGKAGSGISAATAAQLASTHTTNAKDDLEELRENGGDAMLRQGDDKERQVPELTIFDMVDGYGDE
jgi:murein DD-endopeptidase MepM/ murein hydrolase activator NlpD